MPCQIFETLTTDENNHFTTADMLDALEIYQQGYINYPRDAAEYRSGIEFPKNKEMEENKLIILN